MSLIVITGCLTSCATVKQVIQPKKSPNYQFNDQPYNEIDMVDKDLYNYVFVLTKNRLKYYVEHTFSSYPELIGLVLDLKMNGHQTIYKNIVESPVFLGWRIYDEDVVPLSNNEIKQLNDGSGPQCDICKFPKVRYLVKDLNGKAIVYVSYWITQYKTYNFVYNLEKQIRGWTLLEIIEK